MPLAQSHCVGWEMLLEVWELDTRFVSVGSFFVPVALGTHETKGSVRLDEISIRQGLRPAKVGKLRSMPLARPKFNQKY